MKSSASPAGGDVLGAPYCARSSANSCRPLAIAISTAGASPALAKRIRDEIAAEYGEHYARIALLLNEVRGWAKGTLPTYQDRKAFFEGIVNGEPDPIALLREVPRTMTVRARTPLAIYALDRRHFVPTVSGYSDSAAEAETVVETRLAASAARPL